MTRQARQTVIGSESGSGNLPGGPWNLKRCFKLSQAYQA